MQRQIGFPIILCLLILTGMFFSSCTKCVKCSEYLIGSVSGTPKYEFPEECGTKEKMAEYQSYRESQADPGNEIKCTAR